MIDIVWIFAIALFAIISYLLFNLTRPKVIKGSFTFNFPQKHEWELTEPAQVLGYKTVDLHQEKEDTFINEFLGMFHSPLIFAFQVILSLLFFMTGILVALSYFAVIPLSLHQLSPLLMHLLLLVSLVLLILMSTFVYILYIKRIKRERAHRKKKEGREEA